MEEQYPVTVEGDWEPEHAKSVKNKLQIYFQSKKKSRGGDCVVKYNDERNTATILFKTAEVQNIPLESSAVVLEDLPEDFNEDVLTLFVGNITKLAENDYSIEFIPEMSKSVITFKSHCAAGKFLDESRTNEMFKKNHLRARALEMSTSVWVEDLYEPNKLMLELYFEKLGGPVEDVSIIPLENAAIVTFKDEKGKENVLTQDMVLNNAPLKIYPYYESLNTALYGENRPNLKLPEPIVTSLHPTIREFLFKKKLISSISDEMSSQFCQVNLNKADVLLSPDPALLKQKGVTKRQVDGWSKNASDAFTKLISNYTTSEWPVSNVLWSKVERDVKHLVKDQVLTDMDVSKGVLTLAGMSYEVSGLKPIMEKILERATHELERERDSITEKVELSPAMFSLLEKDGLHNALVMAPLLQIDYNQTLQRIVLNGLQAEVLRFQNWVLEKKLSMKLKPLNAESSILDFLKSVDSDVMSSDLFMSHGVAAVYTVEKGGVVLIGSTEKALSEAEKRINMVLASKHLTVEDHTVLKMQEWHDLVKQLQESFNTSKKRSVSVTVPQGDKVTVAGFKEPVMEISESLRSFIEKHSRTDEIVRVKSLAVVEFIKERKSREWKELMKTDEVKVCFDSKRPRIKLSGPCMLVQPMIAFFTSLAQSLHTDTLTIKKAGAKKYFREQGKIMLQVFLKEKRFMVVLQEDDMLEEEPDDFKEGSFDDSTPVSCEVRMPGGVTVTVRNADICTLRVDAVVNAANEHLKHSGGVAFALLKAAGPRLQEDCDLHIRRNGPLKPGDAILTDAAKLPCKYVVHAVGPRYSGSDRRNAEQILRRAVRESLNLAAGKRCSSIAIPVISSGIFGCPLELCTESIAKEVRQHIENQNHRGSSNTFTEIHLVDSNSNTVNAMVQAVKKEFATYNPKMIFSHEAQESGNYGHHGDDQGRAHSYGSENFKKQNQEFENSIHDYRESGGPANSQSHIKTDTFEEPSGAQPKTVHNRLKVDLKIANIQDADVNVIVNTISEDLDLSRGAVSKALLQAAGPQLQSEIKEAVHSKNLNYGEMAITDGYNLKCSRVFHVVCPYWEHRKNSPDVVFIQIIRDCLRAADSQGMTSIAFPAIGTGNLGYPRDIVAKLMLTEFHKFKSTNLQLATVILHPSDKLSIQVFCRMFSSSVQNPTTIGAQAKTTPNAFDTVPSSSLGIQTMQLGQVMLEVLSGDITKEKTDVIVNSSNKKFSARAGVSKAILDAAGPQVDVECASIVGSSFMQKTEIMTSAGRLPCRNIIHIIGRNNAADIKNIVLTVLKMCESQQFGSVAFPALGTGHFFVNPADVADAMVGAVFDFVKKQKPVHVKLVKFLIFQAEMVTDFHQSMGRRSGEKIAEEKSSFSKIKAWFTGSSESASEDFVMVGEEIEPAVFQLCGETTQDLREASDFINSLLVREHLTLPLKDPAIALFTREDAEIINTMQKELSVRVKLEKKGKDSVITLEGLTRDVNTAQNRVLEMIRKVERNETRKRDALIVSTMVKWEYQDKNDVFKSFDMMINYDLEMAFQTKQTTVWIQIDGDEYDANVIRKKAKSSGKRIKLNRIDLEDLSKRSLPSHWDDMKGNPVVLVNLTVGSTEYSEVETEFTKTALRSTIISIERVQNSTLWRNYMIKKEELEQKNNHQNNEKRLFHGTAADSTDHINNTGFNRSYAGMNGAMFGKGSYFAVDPNYSAQGYSKPDRKGHKRMYLARVLVGDFTKGSPGLLAPPAKTSSTADLYNSVTDNVRNPGMFVIFNDVQAYPEYLITFM
ncbi:hypothetical protein DNTS_003714 [Danionella cerebrum]|uniref:Poly [ADP-ribose] polymerase n=1 Tax=Danionella cerebrum TaxID=2873325 RepID=A0A553RDL4_9TELE|nr:hypothetical protein DNTS_003714 [Danionella translucida]